MTPDAVVSADPVATRVWVALASAHIGAVLFYLVALKENLIKAMLHGAKTLPATHAIAGGGARGVKATVWFVSCAAAVWLVVTPH